MTEKRAAERFIYQALTNDAPLTAIVGNRVGRGSLPQSTAPPFVIFSFMAGVMRNAIPGTIAVMVPLLYLIKGVVKADSALVAFDIEDRIDAVLGSNNGAVTVSGATWQVGPWVKETHVEYDEVTPEGVRYIHSGAQYRAWVYRLN